MSFQRILLAHDLSDASDEAMRMAVELAKEDDAALTILHVYPIPVIPMPEGYVLQAPATVVEIQRSIQGTLNALRERAYAMGARNVRTEAKPGVAADEILTTAREGGHDLVVVGTHGRRGLRRMILGSVAETVLRKCPCPVLTVHPGPEEIGVEAP